MNELNEILRKQPILLFDGECVFCNKTVRFFLERERQIKGISSATVHFAALHSDQGIKLLNHFEIGKETDSLVLIKENRVYIKSCAALRLTLYMKGLWPLMRVFLAVPRVIRNGVYDFIAARRIRIWGRIENCAMLSDTDKSRFL